MTPNELKSNTTKDLVLAYKEKARCFHSLRSAEQIYREMELRLGPEVLYNLRLATWHMRSGEGDAEFNEQCDILISEIKS